MEETEKNILRITTWKIQAAPVNCTTRTLYLDVLDVYHSSVIEKAIKIVNIEGKNYEVFKTICRNAMKFSGKMCLMIILKVTKNQGFSFSLGSTFLENCWGMCQTHLFGTFRVKRQTEKYKYCNSWFHKLWKPLN